MLRDRQELAATLARIRHAAGDAQPGDGAARPAATRQRIVRPERIPTAHEVEASSAEKAPWQFGLKSLWLWVSCGAALFALMRWMGATASVVLAWILAMVAAHVAATAWGTGARRGAQGVVLSPPAADWAADPRALRAVPATRLRRSIRVGWLMLGCATAGVIAGGSLGGWLLVLAYAERGAYVAIAFGSAASAVVGGIIAFLASSCLEVTARAFWEALVEAPSRRANEGDQG